MDITISLLKPEIQYDINSIVHLIGNRETAAGGSPEQAANYGSTDGENEKNIIDRFMEKASTDLTVGIASYISSDAQISDNDLINAQVYSFDYFIDVPETFNRAYLAPLRASMHEYIVNRTLFNWFLKTKPDEAAIYGQLSSDTLEEIKTYLHKRTKMLKIRPYPHI